MNSLLFWGYIDTIIILVVAISILIIAWRAYFPIRWFVLIVSLFTTLIGGLIVLFIAELQAPYSSKFYLNPYLYLIFFWLLGGALFALSILSIEVFFKHIRALFIADLGAFSLMMFLYLLSSFYLLTTIYTSYPLIVYCSIELSYGIGVASFLLFAYGCFKTASSDRFKKDFRYKMIVFGILWLINAFCYGFLALGLLYIDFSAALDLNVSIFMLMWVSGAAIIWLFILRGLFKFLT